MKTEVIKFPTYWVGISHFSNITFQCVSMYFLTSMKDNNSDSLLEILLNAAAVLHNDNSLIAGEVLHFTVFN